MMDALVRRSEWVPSSGHTKIESTVRYLGVDVEDALALAEGTEFAELLDLSGSPRRRRLLRQTIDVARTPD
jgi:hypothetical protein